MNIFQNCLFVALGGAIGAVCRYLIGLIPFRHGNDFPINTLLINVVGAFVIGIVFALAAKNIMQNPHTILLLKTGICGGFTTFSTFSLESEQLFAKGHPVTGLFYIILSVILCIVAVFLAQIFIDKI